MLDFFPAEIHGTILAANPGLIYGAMLFNTFYWRLFLELYEMFFWTLIGTLTWMLIEMIIVMLIGMLIGILIGMVISIQNSVNFYKWKLIGMLI